MVKSAKISTGVINFMIHRVNFIISTKINSMFKFKFMLNGIHIIVYYIVRSCYGDTLLNLIHAIL